MGCELTKLAASERSPSMDPDDMHEALNRPPPPADPRSPLTSKQQYCMLASWKGVYRKIETTGILLFVKLFEENEDLLHLFEKFAELKANGELASSEELAEHATKVMHTLDQGIKGLGNIDEFFAFIRHVGSTHRRIPGFKSENFWKVEEPFLQAAKTTLGDRYTTNIETIYKLTIKFILENLVKGYEDAPEILQNGTSETQDETGKQAT